jgi:hypothetical protein
MVVLMLVPLVGLLGIATEGGTWFAIQRAEQNAADAAVIAAATNGGNGGANYATEGQAVSANYGFANGSNNTTVTVPAPLSSASVTSCVSPKTCYAVQITHKTPLYLLQVLGFTGDTTIGSSHAQSITATALATTKTITSVFCLTALGGGGAKKGDGILSDGDPNSTIDCNIQSAGNSTCNGHSLTTRYSDAVGSNNCGTGQHTIPAGSVSVPYTSLVSSIPPSSASGCSNYFPVGYTGPSGNWPTSQNITASKTLPATTYSCGDLEISGGGTVTLTGAAGGSTIVIENGGLDVQPGTTLQTSGVTIIFTSPTPSVDQYTACSGKKCSLSVTNGPIDSGNLDLSSPTTGTWSGMTMYQDPNLPEQSLTYTGNSPTWNISGILYLPVTDLASKGAVNKSTLGYNCFTLVVNTLHVDGTGDLFYSNPQSQCVQQGVTSPTNAAYVIGELVY